MIIGAGVHTTALEVGLCMFATFCQEDFTRDLNWEYLQLQLRGISFIVGPKEKRATVFAPPRTGKQLASHPRCSVWNAQGMILPGITTGQKKWAHSRPIMSQHHTLVRFETASCGHARPTDAFGLPHSVVVSP